MERYQLNFLLTKAALRVREKHLIREALLRIKIQMLCGVCNLSGQLKLILEWCICQMTIHIQSSEEINAIMSG